MLSFKPYYLYLVDVSPRTVNASAPKSVALVELMMSLQIPFSARGKVG